MNKDQNNARIIRLLSIAAIYHAESGHPGGALSCADLLACLIDKNLPYDLTGANHLILSKGHSCPALYAMAAIQNILPYSSITSLRKR